MRAVRLSLVPVLAVIGVGVVGFGATPLGARWQAEPALEVAGDTVVVYGPKRFETPTGQTTVGIESFILSVQPNRQYLLQIANGNSDGSSRALTATVELNGKTVVTVAELGGAYTATRVVQALASDTLRVTLAGSAGAFVDVSVLEISDPTFAVFGPRVLVRQTGSPQTETFSFTVPAAGGAPFYMSVRNGRPDGSHRTSSATIVLNGQQILASSELSQLVGGVTKLVTLQPENTVEATVASIPASEITLTFSATDLAPPVLTFEAPTPNLATNNAALIVAGAVQDHTATTVTVNGAAATRTGDNYSASVALTEGSNTITVSAVDAAGNATDSTRTVTLDTQAPTLVVDAPVDQFVTRFDTVFVRGTVVDASPVTVAVNGIPLPVDGSGAFSGSVSLVEGTNFLTIVASDPVGNVVTLIRRILFDSAAPQLTVSEPADGFTSTEEQITVAGTVTDASAVTVTINGATVTVDANGGFSTATPLALGSNTITVVATDAVSNSTTVTRFGTRTAAGGGLPPDPATVAPPLDNTVATTTFAATEFLYSGTNPIQTGVSPGTINPLRVAVLRGRVVGRDGAPVSGVAVSVLGHPEFGQTLTRTNGEFDLAVNGGAVLTLEYRKFGRLPVQRSLELPWQDFVRVGDVVMVQLDAQVTVIDFSEPVEVARGTPVTDEDGTRQATLMFTAGTTAEMVLPDGSRQPLASLSVRATEYTVGANGLRAMPGALPPTSAYTYAVELSADEAIAAGAAEVRFSQPVRFYVENFLGLPVGMRVPLAYLDRTKAAWMPMADGQVIAVLGAEGIDVTGSGIPTDPSVLAALGIDETERVTLANTYPAGTQLWRASVTHFTPIDLNLPQVPRDPNAVPPRPEEPENGNDQLQKPNDPCESGGSIIECETQILGERIALTGTSFTLDYRSDRVPGRTPERELRIPLIGPAMPNTLERIRYSIEVAGQVHVDSVSAAPNQEVVFVWDGKDAYGREVQGLQPATIRIEYVYPAAYAQPASDPSFGQPGTAILADAPTRAEMTTTLVQRTTMGSLNAQALGFGGWTFGAQHVYDPVGQVLYLGDGSRRSAGALDDVISTVAGSALTGFAGDGGPATSARLRAPNGITVAADGSLYIADTFNHRVRRVGPDGIITTIAGTGTAGFSGDGGPATSAMLSSPVRIAVTADGAVYVADALNHRIRRIAPDGTINTVAGNGTGTFGGEGGPATAASLNRPHGVVVTPDGAIYIADALNNRVRRISPDGMIRTVAGTGVAGFNGDGPGVTAQIARPAGLALGPNGEVYIAELAGDRVRKLTPDGRLTTVVEPASTAPFDVALGPDGTLYIAEINMSSIRQLLPDGRLLPKAGTGFSQSSGDGGPALVAGFEATNGVAVSPDGVIYVAEAGFSRDARIRAMKPMLAGLGTGDILVAGEDGSEIYRFSSAGLHLATLDALTGTPRLTFEYSNGRLIRATDADGNQTLVERAADGTPLAIVAPFGQRTQLALGADGYLSAVTNPASESTQFTYHAGGLLATLTDAKGAGQTFLYDARGRLERDNGRAGEIAAIARVETGTGYEVTLTTALGRATRYTMEQLPDGSRRRVSIDPAGFGTESTTQPDGTVTTLAPDGTTTEVVQGPDPRFGMQAAIMSSFTVTTPGGLTTTAVSGRRTVLATAGDPFSIVSQVDTLVVNGRQSVSTYAASTRTLSTTSTEGRTTASRLDSLGRIVEVSVPGVLAVTSAYDDAGRLASTSQGSLNWSYTYTAAGLLESATDPLSRSSQFVYDAAGRLTTQTFPGGRAVGYSYDDNGNLLSVTPPDRPAHQFTYNASDLPESYTPPAVPGAESPTLYSYNLDRQLTRTTRPDGGTLDFTYDQGGRLSVLAFPGGQLTYTYSTTTGTVSSIAALGGPTLSYTYDGSLARSVSWTGGEVSGRLSFVYDNDFRVATDSVNGGHAVSYGYDQDGLLVAAGSLTLTRDAQNGRLTGTSLDAVASTAAYDSLGLANGTVVTAAGAEVFRTSYRRDALGRLVELAEVVAGEAVTWTYGYDAAGRLSEVTRNGSAYASYEYDANGNRTRVVTAAGAVTASYDAQDRLVSQGMTTYSYSANGTVSEKSVGGSVSRTEYDALGNLRSAVLSDGTSIEYLIDPSDRRIGRKVDGALEKGFLYSGALSPVAELDASGNVVTRFVYGTRSNVPEYMIKGGITYRLVTDHLASVRLVVNASTGAVVQRLDYDPWGKVERNTNPGFQPFGFAGGLYDDATNLTRFGARDYDAEAGRWTAKDPIGFNGGSTNFYLYVVADPVNLSDADGLCPRDPGAQAERICRSMIGAATVTAALEISGLKTLTRIGSLLSRTYRNYRFNTSFHLPIPAAIIAGNRRDIRRVAGALGKVYAGGIISGDAVTLTMETGVGRGYDWVNYVPIIGVSTGNSIFDALAFCFSPGMQ